jgi:hypothetical protein
MDNLILDATQNVIATYMGDRLDGETAQSIQDSFNAINEFIPVMGRYGEGQQTLADLISAALVQVMDAAIVVGGPVPPIDPPPYSPPIKIKPELP